MSEPQVGTHGGSGDDQHRSLFDQLFGAALQRDASARARMAALLGDPALTAAVDALGRGQVPKHRRSDLDHIRALEWGFGGAVPLDASALEHEWRRDQIREVVQAIEQARRTARIRAVKFAIGLAVAAFAVVGAVQIMVWAAHGAITPVSGWRMVVIVSVTSAATVGMLLVGASEWSTSRKRASGYFLSAAATGTVTALTLVSLVPA